MRIAITGGDGFVGGHVARMLELDGHDVVVISRRTGLDLATPDLGELRRRLAGCEAVVLCAGINRESGRQTYGCVHVSATRFIALAQVRILEEGATEVLPFGEAPPGDLAATTRFDRASILAGLPPDAGGFGVRDLRWCRS